MNDVINPPKYKPPFRNRARLILNSLINQRKYIMHLGRSKSAIGFSDLAKIEEKMQTLSSDRSFAVFIVEYFNIIKLLPPSHAKKTLNKLSGLLSESQSLLTS